MTREVDDDSGRLRIWFLSAVVLLTALAIGWLIWGVFNSYQDIEKLSTRNLRIEQLRGSILHLDEVLTMSARMAVETGDPSWEARYRECEPRLGAAIEEAETLVPGVTVGTAVNAIDAANRMLIEKEELAFRHVRLSQRDEARAQLLGADYVSEKQRYSEGIQQLEHALQTSAGAVAERARQSAGVQLVVALAMMPLVVASWVIALRTLIKWRAMLNVSHGRLRHQTEDLMRLLDRGHVTGRQVAASAEQLAESNRQLEKVVNEHVASTQSVTAAARQIAANAEQLTRTVDDVTAISIEAASGAEKGRAVLNRLESAMDAMIGATATITNQLKAIQESADRITSVIETITVVADQTNLLSLNAAIEAEKAGEHGRGFLVVSREIRRLADQTAVSALDIESSVKAMRAAVAGGVDGTQHFSHEIGAGAGEARGVVEQLASFITQVRDLSLRFETVRVGMAEQAQGAHHIRDEMIQLDCAARQTADSLLSSKAAITRLEQTIEQLTAGHEAAR